MVNNKSTSNSTFSMIQLMQGEDMQRYMVDNKNLELDIDDKRHIINVMRMNVGECFKIVYDKKVYTCEITEISKKDVKYKIVNEEEFNNSKDYKVIIATSIIKEQKMDYLLQKSTELGVDEIIPIVSERTVVKIDSKKDNKISRWKKILKEASEQSHRLEIPKIHDVIKLKDIKNIDADIKIFCNTNEMSKNIKKVLQDFQKCGTILIVVGPEGGFSSAEVDFLFTNGFISTTLGSNILRAETVPLFILSVINYEFMR